MSIANRSLPPRFCPLSTVLLFSSLCWAHHGEPPPPPPRLPVEHMEAIRPPRWSWIHWWEANREVYFPDGQESPGQQEMGQRIPEESRKEAVQLLSDAVQSKNVHLRQASVAALGRIGDPGSLNVLADRARADSNAGVRRTAVLSIGLTDCAEAESLLLDDDQLGDGLEDVRIAALGLLSKASKRCTDFLCKAFQGRDVNLASIAASALKRKDDPRAQNALMRALNQSPSSWLASDAILAMGHAGDPAAIPLLIEVLLGRTGAKQVLAYRALEVRQMTVLTEEKERYKQEQQRRRDRIPNRPGGRGGTYPPPPAEGDPFEELARRLNEAQQTDLQSPPLRNRPLPQAGPGKVLTGVEWTYASELRGSAAIALGMIDHPQSRQGLLQALMLPDDPYSDLFKGPTLMSLGRIGDAECLDALLAFLSPKKPTEAQTKSPLRGYAAVALGLYAQPVQKEQAVEDRPEFERALAALTERMNDRRETIEVRTACALGLGLSRRKESLEPLRAMDRRIGPKEEALLGHTLLARGMLGDTDIIEPARRLLLVIKARTDMSGILAQRAAILGLGFLDSPMALPVLREAWHLNYYANREVILALALSSSPEAREMVLDLMKKSKNPEEQAYLARCIGELFAKDRQSRFAQFLTDGNYMMKNENLQPYQSMANEFLFNYLIAAFGDEWR